MGIVEYRPFWILWSILDLVYRLMVVRRVFLLVVSQRIAKSDVVKIRLSCWRRIFFLSFFLFMYIYVHVMKWFGGCQVELYDVISVNQK